MYIRRLFIDLLYTLYFSHRVCIFSFIEYVGVLNITVGVLEYYRWCVRILPLRMGQEGVIEISLVLAWNAF